MRVGALARLAPRGRGTIARMHDLDDVANLLVRQRPSRKPGTKHGYQLMSVALYMQELIRRTDPWRRTLGQFFAEEIAAPPELDFRFGTLLHLSVMRIHCANPVR